MKSKKTIYTDALLEVLQARMGNDSDKELRNQHVFLGVKVFNGFNEPENRGIAVNNFDFASGMMKVMKELTPKEFMNVFPIDKAFNGEKYGMKDYYSTMDYINTLDQDKPIGEKINEFIMEYMNEDIFRFSVKLTLSLSAIRRFDGHLDLMEEFMAQEGMETPNTFKNSKGEAMYVRDGKLEKISKSSNLKVVPENKKVVQGGLENEQ